jgi:hypothetical protein
MGVTPLCVLTHKSNDLLRSFGGTQAWKVLPQRVMRAGYVVVCRLATQWDAETQNEPHRAAVMVGKVLDVVPAPLDPKRYLVRFSEFADIVVPDVFPKQRSPICYMSLTDLAARGVDVGALAYKPMSVANSVTVSPPAGTSQYDHAKAAAAAILNLRPDQLEITVRF